MRKVDAIAAQLVLEFMLRLLYVTTIILLSLIISSVIKWDSYVVTSLLILIAVSLIADYLDAFAVLLLGLWVDLLYSRVIGPSALWFGLAFGMLRHYGYSDGKTWALNFLQRGSVVLGIGLGLLITSYL